MLDKKTYKKSSCPTGTIRKDQGQQEAIQPNLKLKINGLMLVDGIISATLTRETRAQYTEQGFSCYCYLDQMRPVISKKILEMNEIFDCVKINERTLFFKGKSAFDAFYFCRAYLEVLMDFTDKILDFPIGDQLIFFRRASGWEPTLFIKYAKYCTAFPMAKFLQNPLPPVPTDFSENPLFAGKVKRFLKSRILSHSMKNASLMQGILQGVKRGCAPVTESFIQGTMEKHRQALSSTPRGSIDRMDLFKSHYDRFFKDFKPMNPRLFEASTAACFDNPRSQGGSREYIRLGCPTGLIKMYEYRPGEVRSVYGSYSPSLHDAFIEADQESTNVMVSAIIEPLKVRLITKGSPWRYWVSRFYQKSLWDHLQKFEQFQLTGTPLRKDMIERLVSKTDSFLHKMKDKGNKVDFSSLKFVSGDYSAATDELDIRHTKAAFESSLSQWDDQVFRSCSLDPEKDLNDPLDLGFENQYTSMKDVIRSVLYEQKIHYPRTSGLEPIEQQTGQLMGSTLSFPILCTVNLVCLWITLEKFYNVEIDIEDLPVLVNGDDILFRCEERVYELWQETIKEVGFELSIGKNYCHDSFMTVNSELFKFSEGQVLSVNYLNVGLLTGSSKITGRKETKLLPVWDFYNCSVPNARNPERAKKRFIHYHKRTINEFTENGNYNLFLPFERGGLGFQRYEGQTVDVTSFQRRYANYLERRIKEDPESQARIALVSNKSTCQLKLFHERKVTLTSRIGCLNQFECELKDKEIPMPLLARGEDPTDMVEYRVRHPKGEVLRQFRKGTYARMGGIIYEWPYRAVENIKKPFEEVPLKEEYVDSHGRKWNRVYRDEYLYHSRFRESPL